MNTPNRLEQCLLRMPKEGFLHWPKDHIRGQPVDPLKSPLALWLVSQPEILNYIVSRLRSLQLIDYDQASGIWTPTPNVSRRISDLWFAGKDIGHPFTFQPKRILECPALNAQGIRVISWRRWASETLHVSGQSFMRYFAMAIKLRKVKKLGSGRWVITNSIRVPEQGGRPLLGLSTEILPLISPEGSQAKDLQALTMQTLKISRSTFYRKLNELYENKLVDKVNGKWIRTGLDAKLSAPVPTID